MRSTVLQQGKNGQWWHTKGNKAAKEHCDTKKKKKSARPLQFPAKTGDWNYSPAAFVCLLHSFSPFRTNKAGCIRSHEGGSLAAHQAAGRPQENGTAAGEGRSAKCTSQLPHHHTQLLLSLSHTVARTHWIRSQKKQWLKDLLAGEKGLQVGRAEDERKRCEFRSHSFKERKKDKSFEWKILSNQSEKKGTAQETEISSF